MSYLIKNGKIVNRGQITEGDIYVKNGRIVQIGGIIDQPADREIDATGLHVIPGIIDDQVHFREPGLTHKANIFTESRAAVIGGVTSFMEMPNTKPPATTQEKLEEKYELARQTALANYSFFMGASNDNLEEVLKTSLNDICGVKVFMGSSTGNMLVDDAEVLDKLFSRLPHLIATHCEDEATIRAQMKLYLDKYGDNIPIHFHPIIRNTEGCYKSSSFAVELAKKYNTRLHILHISTEKELALFTNEIPLSQKRITAEVCVHHLYFNNADYASLGTQIKCNPAIKSKQDQQALFEGLLSDKLDIIATDHAPHTWAEKQNPYTKAPSGVPLVQHAINIMLDFYHQGKISLERMVEKMCHAPAACFNLSERGFLDEGTWADITLLDIEKEWIVEPSSITYKCGWSPLVGKTFKGAVIGTMVSGHLAYYKGALDESQMGRRLKFKNE